MAGLGFKKQFCSSIVNGEKRSTIRSPRKHPVRAGERLRMWTGLRTAHARCLGEARAVDVAPICIGPVAEWGDAPHDQRIRLFSAWPMKPWPFSMRMGSGWHLLDISDMDIMAWIEGFHGKPDKIFAFFQSNHSHAWPFHGVWIYWGDTFERDCGPKAWREEG